MECPWYKNLGRKQLPKTLRTRLMKRNLQCPLAQVLAEGGGGPPVDILGVTLKDTLDEDEKEEYLFNLGIATCGRGAGPPVDIIGGTLLRIPEGSLRWHI
jgi:hypothetical protein